MMDGEIINALVDLEMEDVIGISSMMLQCSPDSATGKFEGR